MKTLAEMLELEAEEAKEREIARRNSPKPIAIHLIGKRGSPIDYWTSEQTTVITIQPEEGETLWSRNMKLREGFKDPHATALYNLQSQEIFYFYNHAKNKNMTFADIDRLGEEGTVWRMVYRGLDYPPKYSVRGLYFGSGWYSRWPPCPYLLLGVFVRWMMGIKTIPIILMGDLMDGNYLPTWEAMMEFRKKEARKLE
ncbi:hypothetical protein TWF281_004148 [Arthrobotrys megalospora]